MHFLHPFSEKRYLNKKKSAEEMEQQFQNTSSVDYSLKDGETIVLQLKSKVSSFSSRWLLHCDLSHLNTSLLSSPTEKH